MRFSLPLLAAAVLALSGCDAQHLVASATSKSKPWEEYAADPVGLVAIKTVAVIPFDDRTPSGTFDADAFANRFANQLAGEGVFRVLYPADVIGRTVADNRRTARDRDRSRHNARYGIADEPSAGTEGADARTVALDADGAEATPVWDPARREEQAVRLARKAGADAVVVGYVTEADPYMRPRVSLTLRLVGTGRADGAAEAIAELTQWGIPRAHAAGGAGGLILTRQQNYDAREGNIGRDVSTYGRTHHIDNHAYKTEAYVRSMLLYYDVVGLDLAKALVGARKEAEKESRRRAKEEAKRAKRPESEQQSRLDAIIERDERIPDWEDAEHGPGYFDQALPAEKTMLAGGGERRIRSFRPAGGGDLRRPTPAERELRDGREIDPDGRVLAMGGFGNPPGGDLPDPERTTQRSARDVRDKSWRPDVYNAAHPAKALPLYDYAQRTDGGYD